MRKCSILFHSFALSNSRSASSLQPNMSLSSPLLSPLKDRSVEKVSWPGFLATVALVPVWATTLLPLSIVCTLGGQLLKPLAGKTSTAKQQLDSGFVASSITDPKDRKYNIVVLGATGFAGYLAALHLAQTYGVGKSVQWAVAGRSQAKLDNVKKRLEAITPDASRLDTIIVDTLVPATLPRLVDVTRVVVSTAGPFAAYGNSVVEFCAKFGTHYADITGEVEWVQSMINKWQSTAVKTGASLVSFCGHDSIPWDLSTVCLQKLLEEEFDDEMESVLFLDEVVGDPSGGTIATVLRAIEKGTEKNEATTTANPMQLTSTGVPSEHQLQSNVAFNLHKVESPWGSGWTAPFVMAQVNYQVVAWTYAYRSKGSKLTTYDEALIMPDFKTAFCSLAGFVMSGSALLNPFTRYLLKAYVLPKPGEGPSFENMEKKNFLVVKGEAIGRKGNRAQSIFYLSKDAGYMETAKLLVESGLCLGERGNNLPGGFFPPGGMGDKLLDRLLKVDVHFKTKGFPGKTP